MARHPAVSGTTAALIESDEGGMRAVPLISPPAGFRSRHAVQGKERFSNLEATDRRLFVELKHSTYCCAGLQTAGCSALAILHCIPST